MIVAFTGIREIDPAMSEEVELAVADAYAAGYTDMRFGGALGADTMALDASDKMRVFRTVYVPGTVADQPRAAQIAIRRYADEIVELGLPVNRSESYLKRNEKMIAGAKLVIAFTDGRKTGGTAYTIRHAHKLGIPVHTVMVDAVRKNPRITGVDVTAKVYAVEEYDRKSELTKLVLKNKRNDATPAEQRKLARALMREIARHPDLAQAFAICAMPRRAVDLESDMAPIVNWIAAEVGYEIADLERVRKPVGGELRARRVRFPAAEHEATFEYSGIKGKTVILIDNVITSGATMEGAVRAVRAGGGIPVGLAVLFGSSLGAAAA